MVIAGITTTLANHHISIRPARYKPDGTLTPLIADLQSRHEQRAAADPGYQHAVAEIASIACATREAWSALDSCTVNQLTWFLM